MNLEVKIMDDVFTSKDHLKSQKMNRLFNAVLALLALLAAVAEIVL